MMGMLHNPLFPFVSRPTADMKQLENLPRLYLQALLQELPHVLPEAEPAEILRILLLCQRFDKEGLFANFQEPLKPLLVLFQRPDWQSAPWLEPLLKTLQREQELLKMPVRLQLAQHPEPAIRRWVYAQDYQPVDLTFLPALFRPQAEEDPLPLMRLGLSDTEPAIQVASLKYFFQQAPAEKALQTNIQALSQSPDWEVRVWSVLALTQWQTSGFEDPLDTLYQQAGDSEQQALVLLAWLAGLQKLDDAIGKNLQQSWEPRVEKALQSSSAALQQAGASILASLCWTDKANWLRPLFGAKDPAVLSALMLALEKLEPERFEAPLFELLQRTEQLEIKVRGIAYLVNHHPDYSKEHLPQMLLNEPRLAHLLVTKLNQLGWREIPRNWLELAQEDPSGRTGVCIPPPPDTPWLEV